MAVYKSLDELPEIKNAVISIGTFDGVHLGHGAILKQLVQYARQVQGESVLITFEPHPRKLLYPNQRLDIITPLQQKVALLSELGVAHIVVVPFTEAFAKLSAEDYISQFLVKHFKPYAIIIGHDHHFGNDRKGNINMLRALSVQFHYKVLEIPVQLIDSAAVSSTKIRKALWAGQVKDAALMLGRNYSIEGKVVQGQQLGRTIGFPTANIVPLDAEQLIPQIGVYAIRLHWQGKSFLGMLNIGIRPTVSNENKTVIEAHIFNFNENIYDVIVVIEFVAFVRNEKKFDGIEQLKLQLQKDKKEVLLLF